WRKPTKGDPARFYSRVKVKFTMRLTVCIHAPPERCRPVVDFREISSAASEQPHRPAKAALSVPERANEIPRDDAIHGRPWQTMVFLRNRRLEPSCRHIFTAQSLTA